MTKQLDLSSRGTSSAGGVWLIGICLLFKFVVAVECKKHETRSCTLNLGTAVLYGSVHAANLRTVSVLCSVGTFRDGLQCTEERRSWISPEVGVGPMKIVSVDCAFYFSLYHLSCLLLYLLFYLSTFVYDICIK